MKSNLVLLPIWQYLCGIYWLVIPCDCPGKVGMKAASQLCTRKAGYGVKKHALLRFYPTRLIITHFS